MQRVTVVLQSDTAARRDFGHVDVFIQIDDEFPFGMNLKTPRSTIQCELDKKEIHLDQNFLLVHRFDHLSDQ